MQIYYTIILQLPVHPSGFEPETTASKAGMISNFTMGALIMCMQYNTLHSYISNKCAIILIMLLIDKPVGISSFGVVAAVRRATGIKKVGHAGTLDPLASGLMLVLVGREETKRASELLGLDKSYEVTVRIGESRSTGDMEGEIVAHESDIGDITYETLNIALKTMVCTMRLPVPAYSAVKQKGQPLYKKVRNKQKYILPIRDMTVRNAVLLDLKEALLWHGKDEVFKGYEARVLFEVESGVYIRSLSEELGKRVGHLVEGKPYPATTATLRRLTIGEHDIKDAKPLSGI